MLKFSKLFLIISLFSFIACNNHSKDEGNTEKVEQKEVNLYSDRHYEVDNEIFEEFTKETGIKVNIIRAKADELINRLEQEGANSPADLLITVDAGRLYRAQEKGLLQAINSEKLNNSIPNQFRNPEGYWFGLTYRARIIVYNSQKVDPATAPTYESLTNPEWQGKVLVRSSENIYNQSLLASMIATQGADKAKEWATGVVRNMARNPKGNDRDQMKSIMAGVGDVALVNSYYVANMINSDDSAQQAVGKAMGVIFPNQDDRGTHVNISGAGVTKSSPNKDHAVQLLEYLTSKDVQEKFAGANYEYPVVAGVKKSIILESWGEFKIDTVNMALLGKYNRDAIMTFNEAGWQ